MYILTCYKEDFDKEVPLELKFDLAYFAFLLREILLENGFSVKVDYKEK